MATAQHQKRTPIQTHHCRFCNHLLLATTRTLSTLPRRGEGALDRAIIIPLEDGDAEVDVEGEGEGEAEAEAKIEAEENESPSMQQQSSQGTRKSKAKTKHTTLLLSTTLPDKRATLIRREDGIEKRVLLRCGRCRVVVGYYLDKVHWDTANKNRNKEKGVVVGAGEDGDGEERPPAVYVLPGALVETEGMGEGGVGEREWRGWDV